VSGYQLFDALPSHIEDALRASIERFGVLVPVVRDQHGRIIDGHHRARIADEVGVKYRIDMVTVSGEDEAAEIARTLNADRRHLDEEQRREIAAELRRQGHSYRAIGGALGVSHMQAKRDVGKSSTVTDVPVEQPDRVLGLDGKSRPATRTAKPDETEQWQGTLVAARDAREADRAQQALAALDADQSNRRLYDVKRLERVAREHAAEQRRAEPVESSTTAGDVEIRHGDFRQVLGDLSGVDAIITDPPYPQEFIPLFGDLSELASRVLAPNGVLVVMAGQWWMREYLAELDRHMRYRWTAAYIAQGARTRVHAAKVGTGWKPLFLYQRHDADQMRFLVDDLFDAATTSAQSNGDKRFHHWGQSEAGIAEQVERFTEPGGLVVDPFLGGGTTAVVARDLGRRFVGCDIDAAAVATSRGRVA
jgi:site-specific DNA-methyltransferase (adenine-specific)